MIFDSVQGVREYLVANYPKSKTTMACWKVSDYALAIGMYEGEDLVKGVMIYLDPSTSKFILLDSLHADLAVRNYVEYRIEFDEAIALFELLDSMDDDNDDSIFFSDLD